MRNGRARAVILGSGGGRTHWRGSWLGGVSTALVIGEHVYIVDFGRGWAEQFFACDLASPTGRGFETIEACFITHLHADHVIDLTRLLLFGGSDGLWQRSTPVPLIGPGQRNAAFAATFGIKSDTTPICPDAPAPGTREMIAHLTAAFAADLNDQMFDSGAPRPDAWLRAQDIALPQGCDATPQDPAPSMRPIPVYEDARLKATTILVDHRPMVPCFAFRFDTDTGSLVISGDTAPTANLVRLAHRADVLVHEAIDGEWVRGRFKPPLSGDQRAKRDHLLQAHTEISKVGSVAAKAEVKHLVLNHLGPPAVANSDLEKSVVGFSGPITMGLPGVSVLLSTKET